MSEWIDVNDRLPEIDAETGASLNVLAIYNNGSLGCFNRWHEHEGWYWCRASFAWDLYSAECEFDDDYEVTHWMPLPEPPPMNNRLEKQ